MTKCKTKTNGSLKGKHCKTDSKQKKTYPTLKLGEPKTKNFRRNTKYISQDQILCTDDVNNTIKKAKMVKIVSHPIISFKKYNYLMKHVVVMLTDGRKVKINNIDLISGCVRGVLVKE